jgi:hypothetical protein
MATPPAVIVITVTLAAAGIAPTALPAAISTIQVAAAASRERAVGVVAATGTPAGPAAGAVGSLAAAATVGIPAGTTVGTVASHRPAKEHFSISLYICSIYS